MYTMINRVVCSLFIFWKCQRVKERLERKENEMNPNFMNACLLKEPLKDDKCSLLEYNVEPFVKETSHFVNTWWKTSVIRVCATSRYTIQPFTIQRCTRFMHTLCLSFHAMNRLMPADAAYIASKTSDDNSN